MKRFTRWQRFRIFLADWRWSRSWSFARMKHCEHTGGHFWLSPKVAPRFGWYECAKCGCLESRFNKTAGKR